MFPAPHQGPAGAGSFDQTYKCYPSSFFAATKATNDPEAYENSDKILLPPSALHTLAQLHIEYPMLFELKPHNGAKSLHCGVLEFVAEEGQMFVPFWMMENMQLEEGDLLTVRNACLDKGTFVKFRPQSKTFLDLHNPRAVLERTLAKFSCLTKNETIRIFYNDKTYDIDVMELQSRKGPAQAVSIVEADINVDFEAPADYVDPSAQASASAEVFVPDTDFSHAADGGCIVVPSGLHLGEKENFAGDGQSLGGKKKRKKRAKTFTGALSGGPLLPELMVIGQYAEEGQNMPFGYTFATPPVEDTNPNSGISFQGGGGMSLRTAQSTK